MIAFALVGLVCLLIVWTYWYVVTCEGARRGWSRRICHSLGIGLGLLTVLGLTVSVMQVKCANRLALEVQAAAVAESPALTAKR